MALETRHPGGEEVVRNERRGDLLTLTLDRPQQLNALSPAVFEQLESHLRDTDWAGTTAVFLRGAGTSFAAGADVKSYVDLPVEDFLAFARLAARVTDLIDRAPVPVIAVVQGYALGGGFELALACDLIVASRDATFGLPEGRLGLLPGGGGTARLPRAVGRVRANELLFTGRRLSADEAAEWGLVNRVVDEHDLDGAVEELVNGFRACSRSAVATAKQVVSRGLDGPLAVALELERLASASLFASEEGREGVRAFAEKRSPSFRRTDGHR
jgi:enoyl-CoA hydratase